MESTLYLQSTCHFTKLFTQSLLSYTWSILESWLLYILKWANLVLVFEIENTLNEIELCLNLIK